MSCCVPLSPAGDLSDEDDDEELMRTGVRTWSSQGDLLTADEEYDHHTDTLLSALVLHVHGSVNVFLQDASSVSGQRWQRHGPGSSE